MVERKAEAMACKVTVGVVGVVVHTQGQAVTGDAEKDMIPVKVGWEAKTTERFSF